VRVIAGRDLGFRPGLAFQYSNSNYLLLGLIAERVIGRPLPEVMASRLFTPLGMRRSLLGMAPYCDAETACGYSKTPFGIWPIRPWKADWTYSAGGMTSTATDLAKWDVALMSGRILPASTFASMSVPHSGSQYGYGLFIYSNGTHKIVWHDGTVYGFRAMNSMILPDRDAVVVLCNADYAHAVIIAMRIESAIFSIPGGEGEHWDAGLPRYAYPMALGFALPPVVALLVFRRRWVVAALFAILSYATGVYLWPVGLAFGIAGAIVVLIKPAGARRMGSNTKGP
jgi:CubicO group peptidase (beta-lactamase class C family)